MFSLKIVFIILIGNIRDTLIVKSQRFHEILTSFPTLYGFKIIIYLVQFKQKSKMG